MGEEITCRAGVVDDCKGEWKAEPEDWEDSTRNGTTVVCFACYIAIEPFMRMNREDIPSEADEAIGAFKTNSAWCRKHDDPAQLVKKAEESMAKARPGSPYFISAAACKKMAEAEVARRAAA